MIREVREAGARIRFISDGDVAGAIEVAKAGAPVDVLMGVGGTPEGVIAGVCRMAHFGQKYAALVLPLSPCIAWPCFPVLPRVYISKALCGPRAGR